MSDDNYQFKTISDLANEFRSRAVGPVELTEYLLNRIDALDGKLNAFRSVTRERALSEARAAEDAIRNSCDRGPLHGIPYVAKDLYDVRGEATGAGFRLLNDAVVDEDCTVVKKLSEAGMVLLGKTHTVQFAFGAVGVNHDLGTPHNPWSPTPHAPGGSSSGSGVAVGSGLAPMGLGSDTGGSVRIPATLCGIVGLKTTVGRISRAGVFPLSWTLDSVGPLTRSVEDAALTYQIMQGEDDGDPTTKDIGPDDVLTHLKDGAKGLRVVFGETLFFDDADSEVEAAVRQAGKVFESMGANVSSIETPEVAEAMLDEARALMIPAEACHFNRRLLDEHFDEMDPVVAERMIMGRDLSAWRYFGGLRRWAALRASIQNTLSDIDVLLAPTSIIPSLPLETIDADFETYMEYNSQFMRNAAVGNILNLCAVTVPCGFSSSGMPIGLMVYAKPFHEAVALRAAWAYEQETRWKEHRPDLSWAE